MRGGTLFSGVGTPELSAQEIDWQWCAEIDPFACHVLHSHFGYGRPEHMPAPAEAETRKEAKARAAAIKAVAKIPITDRPNLGDVEQVDWNHVRATRPIDLLVAGSPCQSFSVAGKRLGLDDPRGNLALITLKVARLLGVSWLAFENVTGLMSNDEGRDFGAFLALLGECGYGWSYRVLDSRYFGVAQRRRRVFVVGYLGDWRRAGTVLFEPESLRGDLAPRRSTGADIAGSVGGVSEGGGWRVGSDDAAAGQVVGAIRASDGGADPNHAQAGHLIPTSEVVGLTCGDRGISPDQATAGMIQAFGGNNTKGSIEIATACRAKGGTGHGDFESETFIVGPLCANGNAAGSATQQDAECGLIVAHTLRADGFDASEDGSSRGTPLVPTPWPPTLSNPICANEQRTYTQEGTHNFRVRNVVPVPFDTTQITHPENRSNPQPGDPCGTLAKDGHPPAVAFAAPISEPGRRTGRSTENTRHGIGIGEPGDPMFTLGAERPHGIAFSCKDSGGDAGEVAPSLRAMGHDESHANGGGQVAIAAEYAGVRRLMPVECERLQALPDGWTDVRYRGKPAVDGPRYKAVGNAMTSNVIGWILRRIQMADKA